MTGIRKWLLGLAVAVAAASLFAFAQQGQQLHQVHLARLAPSSLLWLHAIANELDLYAEHGVRVTDVQAQNSSALVQAVASGSAEAGIALGDNVMRAIDEGAPVVISGAILSKPVLRLVGTVDSVEQLAGQRVTAGAVTGGTTDLLLYQLQQGGVQADEVELAAIPNSRDRLVGFQNGQLAGGLLIGPYDVMALREGFNLLGVYEDYWLQTPLVLNRNWAENNREAAQGITQALAAAAEWIYDEANREEAVRILSEYTGIESDIADETYQFIVVEQQAISPDLSVPDESLRSIVEISAEVHGNDAPDVDVSRYYDPQYLGD